MKMDDLPSAARRQIRQGKARPATSRVRLDKPKAKEKPCHWHCVCGASFTSWAAAERHTDLGAGHRHIELDLPPAS